MKDFILLSTALCVTSVLFFSDKANALEVSKHLSTIIEPEPIKRVEPKYPISAAREGREGWTTLSFVIDEEGDVSDVLVIESSGSRDINKASLKAISKWKYKPAFENGKPIQQCVNTVQLHFSMGQSKHANKGVSRKFNKQYALAIQALKDKDYKEVEYQLSEMASKNKMHLSESNYMHVLAADFAKTKNDKLLQLSHLNKVSVDTDASNDKFKLSILYQRFSLQIALNQFQNAYHSYETLITLDAAKPYKVKLDKVIADIDTLIDSDSDIVLKANVGEDHWYTSLVRNEFSLINIEGSLHTLDVRCSNKRELFTIENNNTWTIPSSWKQCQVYVFGEKNTHFTFVEHPFTSTVKS